MSFFIALCVFDSNLMALCDTHVRRRWERSMPLRLSLIFVNSLALPSKSEWRQKIDIPIEFLFDLMRPCTIKAVQYSRGSQFDGPRASKLDQYCCLCIYFFRTLNRWNTSNSTHTFSYDTIMLLYTKFISALIQCIPIFDDKIATGFKC